MLLEYEPVLLPSTVLVVREMVGLPEVFQHTPLAVTVAPPSELMFPPDVADMFVMADAFVVVSIGTVGVAETSFTQRTESPMYLVHKSK